jgi:hypothetical protein
MGELPRTIVGPAVVCEFGWTIKGTQCRCVVESIAENVHESLHPSKAIR